MRTTVDFDEELLAAVRENAALRRSTLSYVVQDAVRAYLAAAEVAAVEPFELITAGAPGGPFPSPAQVGELLAAEDLEPYTRK